MDEREAVQSGEAVATPIFNVYRRGYDPEQVDRYVADQQRRLDEALHRASESERKLAAAVGQLRELHRRVAVYESEARSAQPPQLDTLGERVQRILQEAWEGAYNLRQEAEREVAEVREVAQREVEELREQVNRDVEELRQVASREAAEVVDEATRRALHIRDETERRRQLYLERVERDREQAIAQITYLYDQRQGAIAELARLQATVQATIEEMVRSPLGRPAPGVAEAAASAAAAGTGGSEPRGALDRSPSRASAGGADHPGVPAADRAGTGRAAAGAAAGAAGAASAAVEDEAAVEALLAGTATAARRGTQPAADLGLEDLRHAQAELPTGPMERIARPSDWLPGRAGHEREARRAGEEARRHAGRQAPPATPVADEMERQTDAPPAGRHRGVYDAEAEGWT